MAQDISHFILIDPAHNRFYHSNDLSKAWKVKPLPIYSLVLVINFLLCIQTCHQRCGVSETGPGPSLGIKYESPSLEGLVEIKEPFVYTPCIYLHMQCACHDIKDLLSPNSIWATNYPVRHPRVVQSVVTWSTQVWIKVRKILGSGVVYCGSLKPREDNLRGSWSQILIVMSVKASF